MKNKYEEKDKWCLMVMLLYMISGLVSAELLIDENKNNISDVWEARYDMWDPSEMEDEDGDGKSNYEEGLAGTSPRDSTSYFHMKVLGWNKDKPYITWSSRKGKHYQLQKKIGAGPWLNIESEVVGNGDVVGTVDRENLGSPVDYQIVVIDGFNFIPQIQSFLESRDTDADGYNDWIEWRSGTSLIDPDDQLALRDISIENTITFEWHSIVGFHYKVQEWLNQDWVDLGSAFSGTGSTSCYSILPSGSSGIYRLAAYSVDSDNDGLQDWEEFLLGLDPEHPHSREMSRSDGEVVMSELRLGGKVSLEAVNFVLSVESETRGLLRIRREHGFAKINVPLIIQGSAVAGVDYETLPTSITMPFGEDEFLIEVKLISAASISNSKMIEISLGSSSQYERGNVTKRGVVLFKENLLNVKDYGAIGDGIKDDTFAIQSAIDALEMSQNYNGLYFPEGKYLLKTIRNIPTSVISQVNGKKCILLLGLGDLENRDIVLKGEDGAKLYSEVSPTRAHILLCLGNFRSLKIKNLIFEEDSAPLKEIINSEPNGSDGLAIVKVDGRVIEEVTFDKCHFINCHRSISIYGISYEDRGKLANLRITNCKILNPYGSNTENSRSAFGGGQQTYISAWVNTAFYENNLFEGGGEDMSDIVTSPGGVLKDGSHFGSPLRLYFIKNVVRRMGVEALFQINDNTLLGSTKSSFIMPPPDDLTEVHVEVSSNTKIWKNGETIVVRTPFVPGSQASNSNFTIRNFDVQTRILSMTNQGVLGSVPEGTVVKSGRVVYLDEREEPTVITVRDNIFEGKVPTGGLAFPLQKGIAFNARANITGNLVSGFRRGIYGYDEVHTPNYPASRGSIIERNVVVPLNPVDRPGGIVSGIQVLGGYEKISSNLILCPISYQMMGLRADGAMARILDNTVVAEQVVRNAYRSEAWSVGIGFGIYSSFSYARGNYTSGFDNGIGPAKAFSKPSYWVFDHRSYLDGVGVSQAGMITE